MQESSLLTDSFFSFTPSQKPTAGLFYPKDEVSPPSSSPISPQTPSNPFDDPALRAASVQKRAQVPSACSNCRKMHAGCDLQRPCKRCIHNGLEGTCVDVPRKKRVSRKRAKISEEGDQGMTWEGVSYADFFPEQSLIPSSDTNFQQLLETQMPPQETTPSSPLLPLVPVSPPVNNIQSDLSFVVQQLMELKESNRALENKLVGVTQELTDMREKSLKQKALSTTWYSFQPQNNLAISVWAEKEVFGVSGDSCQTRVLLECNDKFVQLLGYPLEVLRNNFTCNKLMVQKICDKKETGVVPKDREWPKRTQVMTSGGLKDVFITINPISDQYNRPKYFVLHIIEIVP